MIELILLAILIFIGVLWFRNLSKKQDQEETEVEGNLQANKWGTYFSIIIVSGFFIWLLITNGNLN
jgi:amino acid transporter|tara:strand:+ start:913 stop:1110 length:198 start_codon:yes stop_codon:yes gene_type:complete